MILDYGQAHNLGLEDVMSKHTLTLLMYVFSDQLTCQRCIVFDSFIMKVQLSQVKGIFSVILIQIAGGKGGDENAERGCKVVSHANFVAHVFE